MSSEAEIRKRKIYRVTFVGFVVNLVLSVLKLAAGIVGRSGAMVADAVHSFSDLATDVVVIAFARISAKPRDDGHDYGHGKYETLATIIISLALGIVGAGILAGSIRDIRIVVDGGCCPGRGWWPSWRLGCRSSSRRFSTATPSVKAVRLTARASWPMPGTTAATPCRRWGRLSASPAPIFWARSGVSPTPSRRSSCGVHLQGGLRSGPHGAERAAGAVRFRPTWRRRFCAS